MAVSPRKNTRSRSRSYSPVKVASPKASPKKAKKKLVKGGVTKPTTLSMVVTAIKAMKDKKGSSVQAIRKYIMANYSKFITATRVSSSIRIALVRGLKTGALVRPKGSTATGATGRFRIGKPAAKKPKTPKKKKAKKAKKVKKATAKKTKKPKKAKSPKKAAKKSTKKPKKSPKKAKRATKPKVKKKGLDSQHPICKNYKV
ncbi:sperm-specific H1/protamine-like protein type 2 [Mizuhopecten yessoensis]|uniref:Sperm-specific protein PHI-2B n=1 Tax=Mizuhopecten yessoensis TaxID=6573 RepID=A0A210R378_MIZYE|nr:sperm-specific H1/protamine-like protein type 2 [Mizuhopecten yessoensis]OWF55425.1 Sperm-specific protein PHI-2B [Mizuhopecten yessoensis]